MNNVIKVAIADDHQLIIDGIKTALADTTEIKIIGEAKNGLEILEVVKIKKPDLVLLDIIMPELDGIEAALELKKKFNAVKIIMLTQFDDRSFIRHCQKIGVEGYLLKDCGKHELVSAIIQVFDGGIYFNLKNRSDVLSFNSNCLKPTISDKELEVLKLLAEDHTYIQIARKLSVELSSVKTYSLRIKNKSGTNTLQGLISWAYKNNIL